MSECEKIGEESVGSKMLQMMGWREGEGLGMYGESSNNIRDIVENNIFFLKKLDPFYTFLDFSNRATNHSQF